MEDLDHIMRQTWQLFVTTFINLLFQSKIQAMSNLNSFVHYTSFTVNHPISLLRWQRDVQT